MTGKQELSIGISVRNLTPQEQAVVRARMVAVVIGADLSDPLRAGEGIVTEFANILVDARVMATVMTTTKGEVGPA